MEIAKEGVRICLFRAHFPPPHPPWFQSTDSRAEGRSLAFFQAWKEKHPCKKRSEKANLFWNTVALELQMEKALLISEINTGFFVFTERKRDIIKAENAKQTNLQLVLNNVQLRILLFN